MNGKFSRWQGCGGWWFGEIEVASDFGRFTLDLVDGSETEAAICDRATAICGELGITLETETTPGGDDGKR